MHERSLVQSLIRQVESILVEEGDGTATEIVVSIGPLSGVEPLLVQSAFEQLAPNSPLAGAQLVIHPSELTASCRRCDESFVVQSFRFCCTACQSPEIQITSGDEFRILTITIEEPCVS
jgi:hydrogenase nickel incorporation protein HypA/HybF